MTSLRQALVGCLDWSGGIGQQSPRALADLVGAWEKYHLRHEVLPFDSAPAWQQGGYFTTNAAQDTRTAS